MFGKDEKALKDLLKAFSKQDKFKNKLSQIQIDRAWKELMGETVYSYTTQIDFYNGTLSITLSNASLKQELLYGREKILKGINEKLGSFLIKNVVIK